MKKENGLNWGTDQGGINAAASLLVACGCRNLTGADLRGAYLRGADLRWADLRGADLTGAYLRGAYLRGAYLRWAHLRGADLRGADLRWADLTGADLRGADLRGADLRWADLRWADLTGADLRGADLRGADLRGADLTEAKGIMVMIGNVGSRGDTTFAVYHESGLRIKCGCLWGSAEAFETRVKETKQEGSLDRDLYLHALEGARIWYQAQKKEANPA